MKRFALMLIVGLTLVAASCGGGTETTSTPPTSSVSTSLPGTPTTVAGGVYYSITPAQLHAMSPSGLFIADADTSYVGEIANTSLFINVNNIANELDKFPADKTAKIVVYCTAGINSRTAAAVLVKAGYTSVMQLTGGIMAWQQQGYPTVFLTRTMT
jgi:rhodanese-related sulfurtransferase